MNQMIKYWSKNSKEQRYSSHSREGERDQLIKHDCLFLLSNSYMKHVKRCHVHHDVEPIALDYLTS